MHPCVYVLAVTTFAMATTEFGIVGIIPRIAFEFSLSLSEAGRVVSVYALAMVAGAVGINLIGQRLRVRAILVYGILLFAAANLLSALAPTYPLLIAGRVFSGLAQGAVYGLGTAAAAIMVERARATQAVSIVFIGPTAAMVLGVPLAALVGDGENWRLVFAAIGGVAVLAFLVLHRIMPDTGGLKVAPARHLVALLGNRRLIAVYAVTILGFGGSSMAFTYFPALLRQDGLGTGFFMTVFGLGTVAGNLIAGRLSDRLGFAIPTLAALAGVAGCLLSLTQVIELPALLAVTLFLWGLFAFSLPALLQTEAVMAARASGLAAAASSLNTAAFNVGIGSAALLSGLLIEGLGIDVVPLVGAALAGLAFIITALL